MLTYCTVVHAIFNRVSEFRFNALKRTDLDLRLSEAESLAETRYYFAMKGGFERVSLEIRNVGLELRYVSLELRYVSLELRYVSLELRYVSLELRYV